MTTQPLDDDDWPPDDPTDEELEALIHDLEENPADFGAEPEDLPFGEVDDEEIDPTLLRPGS